MALFRVAPATVLNIDGVNHHPGSEIELNAKQRRKFRNLIAVGALEEILPEITHETHPELAQMIDQVRETRANHEAEEEPAADGDHV
jgi:hypothetical protein